jgi:cytohesin
VSPRNNSGWTPLHLAVSKSNDNTEVVGLLLDNGADTDVDTEEEESKDVGTPLQIAVVLGHAALVLLLLEHGTAPSDKNDAGATILHNAGFANKGSWTPLHCAAWKGHVAVMLVLIDKGAEVSAKTPAQDTPLHQAAEHGHFDAVRLLLDKGADVSAGGIVTAERLATSGGHSQIAAMLKAEAAGLHLEVAAILEAGSLPTPNLRTQPLNPKP